MTVNTDEILDKDIRTAVRYAAARWQDVRSDIQEEVTQEVWYGVITSSANQRRLLAAPQNERVNMLKYSANQVFSRILAADRVADNDIFVPVEVVKDTLKGNPPSPLLTHLVEVAMLELGCRENAYADAIRRRYEDGIIPSTKQLEDRQRQAHVALTDEVNAAFKRMHSKPAEYFDGSSTPFPTLWDGPKLGNAVDAWTRKSAGGYNDPTGEAAVALVSNPHGRNLFYEETPLVAVLAGSSLQPAVTVPGHPYRERKYWKG